ncbi:MAG: hypothetical protein A7316_08850 [Candidatus Altiarchaeales archaeon WOR_SM1_86-2]|nr:MAG: hypothetical protein A7316_08850 [Candidatus Altiarchaeales archaeon WOR_SM1_86-2]
MINLLTSVDIPIVIVRTDLIIRRATPAAEKVLNAIPADIGRRINDIKLKIDIPDIEQMLLEVMDTPHVKELEIRDKNGRWHLLQIRPYRTDENKIKGAVIALFDIDQIKRSLEEVKEAHEYAESIIETVQEPLVVLDSYLRVIRANRSFYKIFKVSPKEIQNKHIYELGNRQWDIPKLRELLEEIIPENAHFENFEVEHEFPTIGRRVMLLNARRLYKEAGRAEMTLLAIEDVTERKQAEDEIRKFKTISDNANSGIAIVDLAGNIKYLNEYFAGVHGYKPDELIGKNLSIFHTKEQLKEVIEINKKLQETGNYTSLEVWHKHKDGSAFPMLMNGVTIKDEKGKPLFMAATAIDITKRKEAEEELQNAMKELKEIDRMKDEFFSSVTHELQNPLTPVKVQSQLLLDGYFGELTEKQRESVEIIHIGTNRLIRLTDDITTISKMRAGVLRFEFSKNNISEIIENSAGSMELLAREKQITLMKKYPESLLVNCDKDRINQVMENLIGNAIRFTPDNGKIIIGAKRMKNDIIVYVEDTGTGISEGNQKKIFNLFFQVSSKYGGTGLGLSICKNIIDAHHGKIWVESEPGTGSTFTFTLPAIG